MRVLVLGGTLFVGRAIVERARVLGHDVTIFNRGRTNAGLFPEVEHIVGDRNTDLSSLAGRTFDAVVDTSAYFPRQVVAVADTIGDGIGHYTFVSSASVYADHDIPDADEDAPLAEVADPEVEELGPDYGGFKALCERELDARLPGRVHHVRSGLIAGPYDPTNRFTYWVERLSRGGRVLAPEPPDQPVQFIDVRDLADWMLVAAQAGITGSFNAVGPQQTLRRVLEAVVTAVDSSGHLDWIREDFLMDQGVEPWTDLPLWLPPLSVPTHSAFMQRSNRRAVDLGLTISSIEDTVVATREWLRAEPPGSVDKDYGVSLPDAGITAARERELLELWHQKGKEGSQG